MYLVALRVVNGHRRAGPIDEQLLSWTMLLTQDEIALLLPAPVKLAELAVSVALGMRGAVLLPEQLPGGVLVPLQLFVNAYEVGQWAVGIQCRVFARCGRKQSRFHLRLGHLSRQRPTQSRRREPFEVIMDRALADVGAAGDLSLPQLEIETQPQNFSALAHGHSLSGHLDLLSEAQSTRSLVSSAAKLFSTGDSEASRSRFRPSPIRDRLGPGRVIAFSPEQRSESVRNGDRDQPGILIGFVRNPHRDSSTNFVKSSTSVTSECGAIGASFGHRQSLRCERRHVPP